MQRKILSIVLSMILVVSFAACGQKESPKELLRAASENAINMMSAEQDIEMKLNVEMGETEDPGMQMMASMLKNVAIKFHAKSDMKTDIAKMEANGSASMSGMTYDFEMYMNEDKMAIKIPIMPQYIVQDMKGEDGKSLSSFDKEDAKELNKKVMDILFDKIEEKEMVKEENVEVTVNEEKIKVTTVKVSMDDARSKELVNEMFLSIMKDESFRKMIAKSQSNQSKSLGMEKSEEEILEGMDEMTSEFEKNWEEAVKHFTINKFDLTYGIDGKKQVVYSLADIGLKVTDEEKKIDATVSLSINSTAYNINEDMEIKFPELTEENSKSMKELNNPAGM